MRSPFLAAGGDKGESPAKALALSMALAGTLALLSFLPDEHRAKLELCLLAGFAFAGFFAALGFAAGLLRFSDRLQFSSQPAKEDVPRQICEASRECLLVCGQNGKVLYANPAYLALAGGEGACGVRTVEQLFCGPADVTAAIYRLVMAARQGRPGCENVRLCPSLEGGSNAARYMITVEPLALPFEPSARLWTIQEVTAERGGQDDISQELRGAMDFLEHAPLGFFCCDETGAISYMNTTLMAWVGYEPAETRGESLKLTSLFGSEAAELVSSLASIEGKSRAEQFDLELECRSGETFAASLIASLSSSRDGGTRRKVCAFVIKRGASETPAGEMRATEPRFARVFNATPMAIAMVGRTGKIARWNAAFARLMPAALEPQEDGSRMIFAGIASKEHAALKASLASAFRGAAEIAPLDASLSGDGERSARLFFAAADEIDGDTATIYALDTTEQRALQSNFAQSQKMQAIGQLAGGVAHDFNNVLTAIIGHCDLLLGNHRPTDPAFRDLNQIKQNANRAASLVRQLLAFSRRQTLRPQVLQLGDVLSDLQMLMRRLVGERIDLELRHGRDLWLVEADVNQLEQVLVNLIVNARDAMPDGGKIILRTRNLPASGCGRFNEPSLVEADYVEIDVEDFGHGIPPEVKDKIFEPFFTTKDVGKGTGLGLAMVYGIVKQTGGYVFCSSTVGKGTVFSILLPRYTKDEPRSQRASEEAQARAKDLTGRGTILLVEDEESVRAFGARALTSRGFTVLEAACGIEALSIVEQNGSNIDLVVSDVVMPEMDGPTMLGELRKRGVKCKIIFVSGYAEDAFAKNLPEGEDFGFLPKPFSLKQLIEAVKGNQ